MKKITSKMLLVLTAVCVISATVLAYVHISTEERIQKNRKERIERAVYDVLVGIDSYEKISTNPDIFEGKKSNKTVGFAVLSSGMGFQGKIDLMVGVDKDLSKLTGMKVLQSVETPGLGDRIKGIDFRKQFSGMPIPDKKNIEVNAITGATISSKAVGRIVRRAIEDVKGIH